MLSHCLPSASCASDLHAEQGFHPVAVMALSFKRFVAAIVMKAGKARTVPFLPVQGIAIVTGAALVANVFAMHITLVKTAASFSVLRTAVEMVSVSMVYVTATRNSLGMTAVRRGAQRIAVAMDTVILVNAIVRMASWNLTAPKVRGHQWKTRQSLSCRDITTMKQEEAVSYSGP